MTPPDSGRTPTLGIPMAILRVDDADRARRFYVDWLGFDVAFEHRFEPNLPLFVAVRRDETSLGLSEHHGDGTPGGVVWIPVRGLTDYRAALIESSAEALRPEIDPEAPGGLTMTVIDPFGNELRFCEPSV